MPAKATTAATQLNASKALRTLPEFHGGRIFRYDTFTNTVVVEHALVSPGKSAPKSWHRVEYEGNHLTIAVQILEANGYTKVNKDVVNAAILLEASYNQFSSALELVEELPEWDGIARLDRFFFDVCGVEREPEGLTEDGLFDWHRYHAAIARALFISIVARITVPGCKADNMVVLEGPQGTLKSTLLRELAFDRDELFSDSMPHNLSTKDARIHMLGKLIIEFGEVNQMRASRVETVKAFLSARNDRYRPPFGKGEVTRQRQGIFVGTSNTDDYLVDPSGNRRFWPVRCGKIDLDVMKGCRDQLYAEAFAAKMGGEKWHLNEQLEAIARVEQAKRLEVDPWEDKIAAKVVEMRDLAARRGEPFFNVLPTEMLQLAEVAHKDWDQKHLKRVNRILHKLGGENSRLTDEGGQRKRAIRFRLDGGYPS